MSGASFKIPPPPAVQKRITFAVALHEAKDTERRPWVYASDPVDHGHGLMVAHCVKDCPEPATCGCEEQTYLDHGTLSTLYVQAVGADALCCGRDIEQWCAQDADTILQIALWGEVVFG